MALRVSYVSALFTSAKGLLRLQPVRLASFKPPTGPTTDPKTAA
ncbi:uncharacterized protein FTOL_13688 [Fusarium torulosum]|uniref:Uncharacterized protein n=1 Tax=Fusarium torulosum TaxID=33205 RepID=A0AAE8MMN6_9HYPO|nr:uncharacterized protein FTOL_13688 [Fusarium torulosum]